MTATTTWRPSLGAWIDDAGTHFRVWAPEATAVSVVVEGSGARRPLASEGASGYFAGVFRDLTAGTEYRYRLNEGQAFPDPASRSQPHGVHGPSAVVDPRRFNWKAGGWTGIAPDRLVIYELHVGTFTPEGTFAGAADRLESLARLGITAIELMPVADFPGRRNWGYDGVSLFAPAHCYGSPDELRRLVDRAHGLGLAVVLDVVYNHLGPDGNYLPAFSRHYFTDRHHTPWGSALNLDQPRSREVRRFLIENACYWIHEFRLDGLRLDATHAIIDHGPRHLVAELAASVRASVNDRRVWICAEDHRNLVGHLKPESEGGWGLDAVWADDLHHQLHRRAAGDVEGYYADFDGTAEDIARTLRQGWFYTGQPSRRRGEPWGTHPEGITPERFVICLQNHDQVGNRALGDRLHHVVEPAMWRALSALLLFAPQTPLLFMGQEFAASTPFLYFTDHHHELGRDVTAGRRQEFQYFSAFADPEQREAIPDPQAESTFRQSALRWQERDEPGQVHVLRLYEALLGLRATLVAADAGAVDAVAIDEHSLALTRTTRQGVPLTLVVYLGDGGSVSVPGRPATTDRHGALRIALSTEEAVFAPDPEVIALEMHENVARLTFARPGAVVLGHDW
jgi:maltooligosyltrehalose trehalohydrolase